MNLPNDPRQSFDPAERRKGVLRTALVVGGIALAIYIAFVMSGVIGR